jgi:predicted nucleic acid-binding protein
MTTVYLDNCCFNRPFDDQQHPLVKIETETKLLIQAEVLAGKINLVWSYILYQENNDNPYPNRKKQISTWESLANQRITRTADIETHAESLLPMGFKVKDALHVACAVAAGADYFISTDKKVLNKIVPGITIINPMDFVRRHFNED